MNLRNLTFYAAGDGGSGGEAAPAVADAGGMEFAQNYDGHNPGQLVYQDAGNDSAASQVADAGQAPADGGEPTGDQAAAADAAVAAAVTPEEYAAAIAERDQFKAWLPIIERLQGEGYQAPDAVLQALEAQNAQRAEAAEQAFADQRFGELQAAINAGQLTPEGAQAQFDYEMGQRQVAQQLARLQPIEQQYTEWQTGRQIDAAKDEFPNMDPAWVQKLHKATGEPIAALAKASHDYRAKIEADALARYQATKAAAAAQPAPEGASGTPPPVAGAAGSRPWLTSYRDLLGIGQGA